MSKAGICETKPSPTLSKAYVLRIWSGSPWPRMNPTANPPTMFTMMIRIEAMASPFTNLLAPSIEP